MSAQKPALHTAAVLVMLLAATGSMAAPQKIIFDTDSAFFLDDGAALVMVLQRQDRVEILGVTVVSGNQWALQGAEYMQHLLELTGNQDVPLYIGAHRPLVNSAERAQEQANFLGGVSYLGAFGRREVESRQDLEPPYGGEFARSRPRRQDAVSFLIETIESHPGEITILALGPLTNIAMALLLRPDIESQIRSLVFMGGSLRAGGNTTPYAEFNFWFDPEAARHVLRSHIPQKVMFGLDITNRAPFKKADFDQIVAKKTPITEILLADDKRRGRWGFEQNPEGIFYIWDCLAAGYLIDPAFVISEEITKVDVSTTFGPSYGATYEPAGEAARGLAPIRVMLDLDYPRFFALYKDLLTRWP